MPFEYLDEEPKSDKFEYIDAPTEKGDFPDPSKPMIETVKDYPTAAMTDVSVPDYLAVTGVTGLAKAAIPNAMKSWVQGQLERVAANQMLKSAGASIGQIRQLGPEAAREAAQYGLKSGLGDVFTTGMGRDAKIKALQEATGKTIGEMRKAGGAVEENLAEKIGAKLRPEYETGLYAGEKGTLEKALEQVAKTPQTHQDLAKTATKLNRYAAGNKMVQPTTAITDVANALSRENNALLAQKLGSDKAKQYVDALKEMEQQKILEKFMERGEAMETASRGGLTAFHSLKNLIADTFGHRAAAKGAQGLSQALEGQGAAKSAIELTPAVVAEWLDRQDRGYSDGGEVQKQTPVNDISDDIREWVRTKVNDYRKSDYGKLKGLEKVLRESQKDETEEPKDDVNFLQ